MSKTKPARMTWMDTTAQVLTKRQRRLGDQMNEVRHILATLQDEYTVVENMLAVIQKNTPPPGPDAPPTITPARGGNNAATPVSGLLQQQIMDVLPPDKVGAIPIAVLVRRLKETNDKFASTEVTVRCSVYRLIKKGKVESMKDRKLKRVVIWRSE